jgi:pSer/pThr/pTyr-binding forkhead associated (FHA) protein
VTSLVVQEGPGSGSEHPIDGEVTLGRDHTADLVLDDPGISRRHATVRADAGKVTVEDLGSSNGTFVNGERIRGEVELAGGDEVQIGGVVFTVEGADPATAMMGAGAGAGADETQAHPGPAPPPPARGQSPPARRQPRAAPGRLAPPPNEEGNIPALAALFLGPLSIFLLVFSSGAAFFVSLPCAIGAIVLGNIGMRKVDRGETDAHRAFANIGRVSGIIGAVLSTIAMVIFIVVATALDATEDNLGGLIDRIQEEIDGVDVNAPDVDAPDLDAPDAPSDGGSDSGGVEAP